MPVLAGPCERASFLAGDRVVFGSRREGEGLGGIEVVFVRAAVPGRLRETMIEISFAPATNVGRAGE